MFLYNLTLQRATGITHAIHGNFSGKGCLDVMVSHLDYSRLFAYEVMSLSCLFSDNKLSGDTLKTSDQFSIKAHTYITINYGG